MQNSSKALNGFAAELFAGIPVKDIKVSIAWYERLFGCPPSFLPNETEAVWQVGEHHWIYLIEQPEHAGRSIQTVLGNNLDKLIAEISDRGIEFSKEETPAENVRKVMYFDPDGNEVGLGSAASR